MAAKVPRRSYYLYCFYYLNDLGRLGSGQKMIETKKITKTVSPSRQGGGLVTGTSRHGGEGAQKEILSILSLSFQLSTFRRGQDWSRASPATRDIIFIISIICIIFPGIR
jgi:hypothetical protein